MVCNAPTGKSVAVTLLAYPLALCVKSEGFHSFPPTGAPTLSVPPSPEALYSPRFFRPHARTVGIRTRHKTRLHLARFCLLTRGTRCLGLVFFRTVSVLLTTRAFSLQVHVPQIYQVPSRSASLLHLLSLLVFHPVMLFCLALFWLACLRLTQKYGW